MVDVITLSQMDPRWKDKLLGNASVSIGKYGCLMTCMTMLANYYGFNETPDSVNQKMKAADGFQGALIMPSVLPAALPGMRFHDFINCQSTPAPMAEIDAYLAQGKPVIVEVDYSPNAGLQNHWVVLYAKRASDYLLRDPYPYPAQTGEVTLLTSRYKFGGTPAQIIQGVVYLDCDGGPQPVKPVAHLDTSVKASFPVYAAADGLAIRSQTLVADNTLIKRVAMGAKLTVLEADAAARAKIGVLNQWLAVQDPADGTLGYAAAWYVSTRTPGSTSAITQATPAPAPASLIVKTIDEGVALRSQPTISDATLVTRVPVNTELICLEPYNDALKKVGVVYEWLKVRDVTNGEYYVAAWYVKAVNGQAVLGAKDRGESPSFALAAPAPVQMPVVRAGVDDLVLRSMPIILRETLLKRLPVDSELAVLEDPALAEPKIGQTGQWLHVRDITGAEGYVAAWYIVKRPEVVVDERKPVLG